MRTPVSTNRFKHPVHPKAKTILRAAKDLGHAEVGRRVGAAKLLGKYPGSQSAFILVDALDDKSPLVRRSVMVSLAEHASNGYPLYEKSLVEKVYSKLGDSDVEVRREVSTMIPRLVSGLGRSGVEVVEINGRKIFRSVPPTVRADLLQITQKSIPRYGCHRAAKRLEIPYLSGRAFAGCNPCKTFGGFGSWGSFDRS